VPQQSLQSFRRLLKFDPLAITETILINIHEVFDYNDRHNSRQQAQLLLQFFYSFIDLLALASTQCFLACLIDSSRHILLQQPSAGELALIESEIAPAVR